MRDRSIQLNPRLDTMFQLSVQIDRISLAASSKRLLSSRNVCLPVSKRGLRSTVFPSLSLPVEAFARAFARVRGECKCRARARDEAELEEAGGNRRPRGRDERSQSPMSRDDLLAATRLIDRYHPLLHAAQDGARAHTASYK